MSSPTAVIRLPNTLSAGALACLAKPVDPRLFVDVMTGLIPTAALRPRRDDAAPLSAQETGSPSAEAFLSTLPDRISAITTAAQAGDAAAVALAADALAGASDRLGHAEVAFVSSAIARDARRGTVTHGRLATLMELCARLDGSGRTLEAQATSR